MLSNRAIEVVENSNSNSFAIDLKKWFSIMKTYENGGHAYHTTMPTDSLTHFRDTMLENWYGLTNYTKISGNLVIE